jgi:hypothetical protein
MKQATRRRQRRTRRLRRGGDENIARGNRLHSELVREVKTLGFDSFAHKYRTNLDRSSDVMISFIEKLEENKEVYDLINSDEINDTIDKVSINFLKNNNINNKDECIVRSFLYGNPEKFAFKLSTSDIKYKTKISRNMVDAKYQEIQYYTNTLTNKSYSVLLYLNSILKDTNTDKILEFSLVNRIDPRWLLDTNILSINSLATSKISGDAYERLVQIIKNNRNLNNFIWNNEQFPILSYFCKNIKNLLNN